MWASSKIGLRKVIGIEVVFISSVMYSVFIIHSFLGHAENDGLCESH